MGTFLTSYKGTFSKSRDSATPRPSFQRVRCGVVSINSIFSPCLLTPTLSFTNSGRKTNLPSQQCRSIYP